MTKRPAPDARPLTIAVVCFPTFGGSGVLASELALAEAARGHRVFVVAARPPPRIARADDAHGLTFVPVDGPVPTDPLDLGAGSAALTETLVALDARAPLDVIHAHYAIPHAIAALDARRRLASRPLVVTTLHGTDVTFHGVDRALLPLARRAAVESDVVTVPSAFLRDVVHETLTDARDVHVIANFVDTARFVPRADRGPLRALLRDAHAARGQTFVDDDLRDDDPVVFHVSNFRAVKRPADVVDVFAAVAHPRARLVMLGDGPLRADVLDRAAARGVADRAFFVGSFDRFAELLACASVFLLTSSSESFGLAALEAMSAGVPVVGTDQGGLREVVRVGETGLLAPVGDIAALADAVRALVDDEAKRRAFAQAARSDAVLRFDRDAAVDRYLAVTLAGLARRG